MRGKWMLYVSHHGQRMLVRTVRELQRRSGGGSASRMYVDKKDGSVVHVGYVVGRTWWTAYVPFEG